uniref:Cyclic nucleotide-binding domain-containing protein n=1 Tax=Plectus sambesii TaxID=2011161 RepID=A0A914WVD1_9BILA
MDRYKDDFYRALSKPPQQRNDNDLRIIYYCFRRLDIFANLNDAPLRAICRSARFERHPENSILFRKDQLATCWYILLNGVVFMDQQMHLPIGCVALCERITQQRRALSGGVVATLRRRGFTERHLESAKERKEIPRNSTWCITVLSLSLSLCGGLEERPPVWSAERTNDLETAERAIRRFDVPGRSDLLRTATISISPSERVRRP